MKKAIQIGVYAAFLTAFSAAADPVAAPDGPRLVLAGVGRFAALADLSTIRRDGDQVRMRSLQVTEADFTAGGERYWGGWSWWAFDCAARTADRLDFASVREGGAEGPAVPDNAAPAPVDPAGDTARLLAVACEPTSAGEFDADSLEDAVRIGREALRQGN